MNNDEELAKRLQDIEFNEAQRQAQRQTEHDEAYARRLAEEEARRQRPSPASDGHPYGMMAIQPGQKIAIRLFHPHTRSSIGESVYVHYLDRTMMLFELVTMPKKYLRVRNDGIAGILSNLITKNSNPTSSISYYSDNRRIDFAEIPPSDYSAVFIFEIISGGRMFLRSMSPYRGFGKYLSLVNGMLRGDGDANYLAEWMMIAAAALPPAPHPVTTSRGLLPPPPTASPPASTLTTRENQNTSRESAVLPAGYMNLPQNDDDHFEAYNPIFRGTRPESTNYPTSPTANSSSSSSSSSNTSSLSPSSNSSNNRQSIVDSARVTSASNLFYLSQSFSPTTRTHDNNQPPPPETSNPDQIFAWLTTTNEGKEYLKKPALEPVRKLLQAGLLINILHRPDWVSLASRYQDFQKEVIPYDARIAKRGLPDAAMRRFFEQGYVILDRVVGPEDLLKVRRYCNHYILSKSNSIAKKDIHNNDNNNIIIYALQNNAYGELCLTGAIESDYDILKLFYSTPIVDIAQRLLGQDEINRPKTAKVALHPPSIAESFERISQQGRSWRVEGFTPAGNQAPHSLIIGIAISDFLADNEGNFCVHPKSHEILHETLKDEVRMKRAMFADASPNPDKPDLGAPKQLRMKAGDVFLCTSKLATQITPNLSFEIKNMIYFHIVHVDYAVLKDPSLDGVGGVWIEYKGVDILDKPPSQDDRLDETPSSLQTTDTLIEVSANELIPTITSSEV